MDILFNEEYAQKMYVLDEKRIAHEEGKAEGRAEGKAEGKVEGKAEGILEAVRSLMANMGTSAEKALSMIGIPRNEWDMYLPKLG